VQRIMDEDWHTISPSEGMDIARVAAELVAALHRELGEIKNLKGMADTLESAALDYNEWS